MQLIAVLLVLLASVAPAAVLPEDRADVLYHRYEGGGMTIQGPSVLVRKSVKEKVSLSANYYVDKVSAASIDVLTSASPYEEERKQKSVGIDLLSGKAIYSLSYTASDESDYSARTYSFGASQDFFGDLTTFSFGYAQGDDEVSRSGDPFFSEQAQRRHFRFGLTQVLTRNWLAAISHEAITDEGYLNNPYRSVRYETGTGYSFQSERYPNTRTSEATAVRSSHYLPWRAALHAEYRRFEDSWGIESSDWGMRFVQPVGKHWEAELRFREYRQTAADFYSDLFPFQDAQNFLARDKELSTFDSTSLGLALSWEFYRNRNRFLERMAIRVSVDDYRFDYRNFRDITVQGVPPGAEPLYSFDAQVTQLLFSVWY